MAHEKHWQLLPEDKLRQVSVHFLYRVEKQRTEVNQ